MNNKSGNFARGGAGFIDLLAVAFIVLKLCGVIDWSWWIVLSPIWGTFLLVFVFIFLIKNISKKGDRL